MIFDSQHLPPPVEAGIGGTLVTAPWWVPYLAQINLIASTAAAVLGVVVGAHAVWRIWQNRNK